VKHIPAFLHPKHQPLAWFIGFLTLEIMSRELIRQESLDIVTIMENIVSKNAA
jgi:hypothetical protein